MISGLMYYVAERQENWHRFVFFQKYVCNVRVHQINKLHQFSLAITGLLTASTPIACLIRPGVRGIDSSPAYILCRLNRTDLPKRRSIRTLRERGPSKKELRQTHPILATLCSRWLYIPWTPPVYNGVTVGCNGYRRYSKLLFSCTGS